MLAQLNVQDEAQTELFEGLSDVPTRDLGVGAALWEATGGQWKLIKCVCVPGYEAGSPPSEPGKYEGQIIQKLCQPIGQ